MPPSPLSGYAFRNDKLKLQALTHSSKGTANNETLEFLGDAVLQFIVTSLLYERFGKKYKEGELTELRKTLVNNSTLAKIATMEGLQLTTGPSMKNKKNSNAMLADAVEAMIGAIYLDAGIAKCHKLVASLYDRHKLCPNKLPEKSAKNQLQELLQKHGNDLPEYKLVNKKENKDGSATFTVKCHSAIGTAQGSGDTKTMAEQAAAKRLLQKTEKV